MSDLSSISEVLLRYGWGGVTFVILFTIITVLAVRYFSSRIGNRINVDISTGIDRISENLTENMSKQNENLVRAMSDQNSRLIEYFINNRRESADTHDRKLMQRMNLSKDITFKMKDILNINHCQRVSIIEFHNSNFNIDGSPFAKYSMTYEWVDYNTPSIMIQSKDVQFSVISYIYYEVLHSGGGYFRLENMESVKEQNPVLYQLKNSQGVQSELYVGMYDDRNTLIGLLGLEWHTYPIPSFIDVDDLMTDASALCALLNIHNNYEKC